jgi:hypothetical protein
MAPLQRRMTKGELKKKEEADSLAHREEELAEKINESQSKHDRILADNKFKTAQLRNFQKQVERRLELNRRELVSEESGMDSMAIKNEDLLYQLGVNKNEYLLQLESYDVIERENYRARQDVNLYRDELSKSKNRNNEDIAKLRKEMFEIRMKIELTFRKTKKQSEEEYEKKANFTMREESDKAVVENARLKSVLTVKRDTVMAKMGQQKSKETRMKKEKIDRDISEKSVGLQEDEIELLERYQKEQEIVVSRTQSQIASLHTNLKSMQQVVKDLERSSSKLAVARREYAESRSKSNQWKKHCKHMIGEIDKWIAHDCPPNMQVGYIPGFVDDESSVVTRASTLSHSLQRESAADEDEDDDDVEYIWKASAEGGSDTRNVISRGIGGGFKTTATAFVETTTIF